MAQGNAKVEYRVTKVGTLSQLPVFVMARIKEQIKKETEEDQKKIVKSLLHIVGRKAVEYARDYIEKNFYSKVPEGKYYKRLGSHRGFLNTISYSVRGDSVILYCDWDKLWHWNVNESNEYSDSGLSGSSTEFNYHKSMDGQNVTTALTDYILMGYPMYTLNGRGNDSKFQMKKIQIPRIYEGLVQDFNEKMEFFLKKEYEQKLHEMGYKTDASVFRK